MSSAIFKVRCNTIFFTVKQFLIKFSLVIFGDFNSISYNQSSNHFAVRIFHQMRFIIVYFKSIVTNNFGYQWNKDTDENVFMNNQFIYGADGRSNAGYGFWQMAYGSTGATKAQG